MPSTLIFSLHCFFYQSDLIVRNSRPNTHETSRCSSALFFHVCSRMQYNTCTESSRRSAWSSFCIKCKADGLQQHQHKRLRGLKTAITARELTSPVHRLPTALCSQCAFGCPLTVERQTTNNPLSLAGWAHEIAVSSRPCVRFQSMPLLFSSPIRCLCFSSALAPFPRSHSVGYVWISLRFFPFKSPLPFFILSPNLDLCLFDRSHCLAASPAAAVGAQA